MCVQSIYTFLYIDMPDVTASYGTPFDFIAFLGIFIQKKTILFSRNPERPHSSRRTYQFIQRPSKRKMRFGLF